MKRIVCYFFSMDTMKKDAMFTSLLEEDNIILGDQTHSSFVCCLEPAWFNRRVDYRTKRETKKNV